MFCGIFSNLLSNEPKTLFDFNFYDLTKADKYTKWGTVITGEVMSSYSMQESNTDSKDH